MKSTTAYSVTILVWGLIPLLNAQSFRRDTDTIVMGAGYVQQVYYQLSSGRQEPALRCGWHLAFEVPIRGAAIRANHACGVVVYKTTRDTTQWAQLSVADTLHPLYDDLCYWQKGAFNITAGPSAFDVGWGIYNLQDHVVRGDSLYIIRIGSTFKKLWIQRLQGTDYFIRIANPDNTQDTAYAVNKSLASGKNFIYLNLLTHQVLDLEPTPQNWDLLFTQYVRFISPPNQPNVSVPYNLVGILMNLDVRAARVRLTSQANPDTLTVGAYPLDSCISVIGDDWKRFVNGSWSLADTLYFLVRDKAGAMWRIRFIGFEGSATGKVYLEKAQLTPATYFPTSKNKGEVVIYPQPAREGIYLILPKVQSIRGELLTLTGRLLLSFEAGDAEQLFLPRPEGLVEGVYLLRLSSAGYGWVQKVIFE
ncbi:MAG: hypothetical protein N2253_08980 [Bacteroidia bacterium]|nr:hypothetical protein [Bacteroidia bacterium]